MTKKIIKASDVLGDNYYIYELTSSNYTPALNSTITITCTMKDVYGAAASSKSITLYQNGTSKGSQTTNSSGVATWSITCSNAGIQSFKVENKIIEVFVDNKSDNTHTHIINLNSFNFYDADNWRTIDGNAPTITSDSIQANAVSHHILNKEFVGSKYYTLTFEFNIGSNRGGFYLFGDEDCNMLFEVTTDIRNTCILQHDSNGNTTELYAGTKNHFTSGWHNIRVIRKGDIAIVYIDDELYYTFNNIGNTTNIFGLLKWSSGSATIKNIDVSLDVTELPIEDYIKKDPLKTIEGVNLVGNGDIAIDMSCGGSTVIFEDDCSSVSGLSNYGSSVLIRGTNAIATISYDSTDNCYALTGSGNYHSAIPIPVLNDKDNYSIEADFKCGYNNELTTIGFVVRDYNDTSIQSTSFQLKGNGTFRKINYTIGLDKDYTGEKISYSPYTYWVHMRLEITGASVKVELSYDGTIFKTYNYTTETITNRQVGLFLFCERGSTNSKCWVKNIKAEYLCESSTIIFEDGASVDNSSTLFGNSVVLRNSGANTTAWNNGGYYTIQNTVGSSESMRVIAPLTGFTRDFTLEYDSYVESTDGASGFVIYDSSTSFIGLQNDGNNYGFFYNDGSYHETNLGSGDTKQKWVHFKFIVQGTNFTLECYDNDVLQYTTTQTIHFNRSSSTMYGFEVKWTVNRITRYKNIVVKNTENTIYLGDDIMTMIDIALEHMITNWEDYE